MLATTDRFQDDNTLLLPPFFLIFVTFVVTAPLFAVPTGQFAEIQRAQEAWLLVTRPLLYIHGTLGVFWALQLAVASLLPCIVVAGSHLFFEALNVPPVCLLVLLQRRDLFVLLIKLPLRLPSELLHCFVRFLYLILAPRVFCLQVLYLFL